MNNATNIHFQDGTALKTHQLICDIVDGYIDPDVKKNFSKMRNQETGSILVVVLQKLKT